MSSVPAPGFDGMCGLFYAPECVRDGRGGNSVNG
jgi:hypothetical protein